MIERITRLWQEASGIWAQGGWAMIAIAAIALVLFGVGVNVYLELGRKGFTRLREETWRRWIDRAAERRGPMGALLDSVSGIETVEATASAFDEVRAAETEPFERDLRVMKVCVGAAPLVGLLGTVTGMLTTFDALSGGSGGDQTMATIAGGISEALVTTETGLVIALPGLFFQYQLTRKLERYKAFLAHLESALTQRVHRGDSSVLLDAARAQARLELRARLAERLRARRATTEARPAPRPASTPTLELSGSTAS